MPSRRVEVGSKCHVAVESGWTLERRVEEKWVPVVMFWATSVPCGRNRPAGARQVPVISRGLHGRRGADPPQSRAAWLRRALQAPPRPMVQRGKRQLHFSSLCRVDCFDCVVHTTQHTSIFATKTTPSVTRPDRDLPGHHRRHPHRPPSLSLSAIAVMTTTFVAEQRSLDSGKLNASNRSAPRPPCLGRQTLNCRC